jgi:hypothetical protein
MLSEGLLLRPRSVSRLIQLGRSCSSPTGRARFFKPHAPLHCHPHPFPRFQEYFRRPGLHNGAVTLRNSNPKSRVPLRNEVRTGKAHNLLLSFCGGQRSPPSQAGPETNSCRSPYAFERRNVVGDESYSKQFIASSSRPSQQDLETKIDLSLIFSEPSRNGLFGQKCLVMAAVFGVLAEPSKPQFDGRWRERDQNKGRN